MFEEIIDQVLAENWYKVESSMGNVQEHQAQLQRELNDLSEAHKRELVKSSRKKIKREMERRQKDLKGLEATLSQYESSLRGARVPPGETLASKDDLSDSMAEVLWLLHWWPMMLPQ